MVWVVRSNEGSYRKELPAAHAFLSKTLLIFDEHLKNKKFLSLLLVYLVTSGETQYLAKNDCSKKQMNLHEHLNNKKIPMLFRFISNFYILR